MEVQAGSLAGVEEVRLLEKNKLKRTLEYQSQS